MNKEKFARTCWITGAALLIVPLLVRWAIMAGAGRAGLRQVIDFLFDDGYYYLAIAANLAQSGHSTLDGLTATNGYQPLWLLVLSVFARLIGTNTWTLFLASCALIYALAIAAPLLALFWFRTSWRQVTLCFAAGLSVIVIQQPELFLEGLEPILFLPLALPLVVLLESATDSRRLLTLSALLAVAFLVRLDSLALVVAAALVPSVQYASPFTSRPAAAVAQAVRITARLLVFVVPTVLAYLAINQWLFGSAVPVSGIAKMIGGPKFSNWAVIGEFFSRWKSFGFLLVLLAPLELLARGAGRADRLFYRSFCVISLAALIQSLYYAAFSTWSVWPWYSYLVALDMAIVAARIVYLGAAIIETPGAQFAAVAAVALLGTWTVYRSGMFIERSLPAQVRSQLPAKLGGGQASSAKRSFNDVSLSMLDDFFASRAHTVIAMGDRAGGLAYWGRSSVSLVQTEGLTLDADYIRARLADRGAEYLASRYPIEYLVIDREHVPTIKDAAGESEFVIPEPIQGRISTDPVPTFCFPPSAVRYEKAYAGDYGTNRRLAFAFGARVPCSAAALELVRSAGTSLGLRRFSLPSEYLQ